MNGKLYAASDSPKLVVTLDPTSGAATMSANFKDTAVADQLGPEQIRTYQVYLLNERKLGVCTVGNCTAGANRRVLVRNRTRSCVVAALPPSPATIRPLERPICGHLPRNRGNHCSAARSERTFFRIGMS